MGNKPVNRSGIPIVGCILPEERDTANRPMTFGNSRMGITTSWPGINLNQREVFFRMQRKRWRTRSTTIFALTWNVAGKTSAAGLG